MALGARRRDILRLILGQGSVVTLLGVTAGTLGALALTRLVKGLLYEISPDDPVAFVAAGVFLAGAALLGTYIPARRATKVDPMVALRVE